MNIDQLAGEAGKDRAAFGALYDQLYSRVYNYARYRCDDLATAEDLTAQAFERLLGAIGSYDPERGPFEPWLWAIVRNLVASHLRARAFHPWLPWEWFKNHADPAPSPEETTLLRESEAALLAALPGLKPRQRDLLGLKYGSGLTNQQIAALTGLSAGSVAVSLHRALESLRLALSPSEAGSSVPVPKEIENAHK